MQNILEIETKKNLLVFNSLFIPGWNSVHECHKSDGANLDLVHRHILGT